MLNVEESWPIKYANWQGDGDAVQELAVDLSWWNRSQIGALYDINRVSWRALIFYRCYLNKNGGLVFYYEISNFDDFNVGAGEWL